MICFKCKGLHYIEKQCFYCHGSGEGRAEGSTCKRCGGTGTWHYICGCQKDMSDYDTDKDGASCASDSWFFNIDERG